MEWKADRILNQRYRLAERIGTGGFSVVWKAIDLHTGNMPVAVKVFMPDKGVDPHLIDMFRDEFNLTSTLDDNRLVRMTDYFVEEESPCLVMPYMPGGSLYHKLQKAGPLSEREVARVLYQVGGALHYLHAQEKPVLHLDIKPENILIDYSGNYLLADFGISLKMRSSLLRASNTKGGTFAYTPPEMSESRKAGPPADIFSLGVMLFELCTGDLPWSGMGGNAVIIGMPLPLLPDTYSLRLQQMIHLCLGRYPHERPTALQLEELARKYLDRGYWDALIPEEPEEGLEKAKPEPDSTSRPQPPPPAPPASAEPEKKGRATQRVPAPATYKKTIEKNQPKPEDKLGKDLWKAFVFTIGIVLIFGLLIFFGPDKADRNKTAIEDSESHSNSLSLVDLQSIETGMVFVKGGTFTMGCTPEQGSDCDYDEKPAHQVTLSDFYIGKYEVTVAQFKQFIDETSYRTDADKDGGSCIWTGSTWEKRAGINWIHDASGNVRPQSEYNHPVIHVSWNDAVEFGKWLSRKTGKKYRLPTEAEWEYAARGGASTNSASTGSAFGTKYAGSNNVDKVAWYDANSGGKTRPVGGKKPNELGLYDMSGNVWEWCADWYGSYSSGSQINPQGPRLEGSYRVLRGGCWLHDAQDCRVSNRSFRPPDDRIFLNGFRLVRSP